MLAIIKYQANLSSPFSKQSESLFPWAAHSLSQPCWQLLLSCSHSASTWPKGQELSGVNWCFCYVHRCFCTACNKSKKDEDYKHMGTVVFVVLCTVKWGMNPPQGPPKTSLISRSKGAGHVRFSSGKILVINLQRHLSTLVIPSVTV